MQHALLKCLEGLGGAVQLGQRETQIEQMLPQLVTKIGIIPAFLDRASEDLGALPQIDIGLQGALRLEMDAADSVQTLQQSNLIVSDVRVVASQLAVHGQGAFEIAQCGVPVLPAEFEDTQSVQGSRQLLF